MLSSNLNANNNIINTNTSRTNNIVLSNNTQNLTNNIIIPISNVQRTSHILDNSGLDNYSSEFNNNEDYSESNNNNRNFETQLDDIFDQLTNAISTEKQNLNSEKTNLLKEKHKFTHLKNSEKIKIEKDKETWKENNRIVESLNIKETDILDLDIGGTQKITTTRATLLKVNYYLI